MFILPGALFCGETSLEFLDKRPSPTVFYLVRHGQTDWNIEKRLQGQSDIPLNDAGRAEAALLSEKLDGVAFTACFASDLQRAAETAKILSTARSFPVKLDHRLRERNFGPWEGHLASEFMASLEQGQQLVAVETDEAIQQRVFPCLNEIADLFPGATVLIVTHGGVIRSLLAQLLSFDCSSIFDIQVKNMALLQLSFSDGQCEIQEMAGIQIP